MTKFRFTLITNLKSLKLVVFLDRYKTSLAVIKRQIITVKTETVDLRSTFIIKLYEYLKVGRFRFKPN